LTKLIVQPKGNEIMKHITTLTLILFTLLALPTTVNAKASQADIDECNALITTALSDRTLSAHTKQHRKAEKLCKQGKSSAVEKIVNRAAKKNGKDSSASCMTTIETAVSSRYITANSKHYRQAKKLCKKGKLDKLDALLAQLENKIKGGSNKQEAIDACLTTLKQAVTDRTLSNGERAYRQAEKFCEKGQSAKLDTLLAKLEKKKGKGNITVKKSACETSVKTASSRGEIRKNSSAYRKLISQCKRGAFTAVETALAKATPATTTSTTSTTSSTTASTTNSATTTKKLTKLDH
jgi:hypothetical protein